MIGLVGDGSGALAERPATKSLGGRIVGHFQNLRAEHRAEKLEVMKAFKAALQAEYGSVIGATAFADAVGQLGGKSLSGRQIQSAITAAETAREQLLTANLGQIARQGPKGAQFADNLQKIGIQADGLGPNARDAIKTEPQRGLHEAGGGRPVLAERPLRLRHRQAPRQAGRQLPGQHHQRPAHQYRKAARHSPAPRASRRGGRGITADGS